MSKFFSLIHGDEVHPAPQKKIIPAKEFSTLMNAQEVLESVQKDAEQFRLEVAKECQVLKEQAQQEGFKEGFNHWIDHIAQLEAEIIKVRQDLEKVLAPVALAAAKKIVGREIELSENAIVDIVSNSLKAVAQHKRVTIYVNRKDLEALENHRPQLKQIFESLEVLSIRERADIKQGGSIIETEGGIINAQLENQWRALENALEMILKKKRE
jgi:type III secretion protein L